MSIRHSLLQTKILGALNIQGAAEYALEKVKAATPVWAGESFAGHEPGKMRDETFARLTEDGFEIVCPTYYSVWVVFGTGNGQRQPPDPYMERTVVEEQANITRIIAGS